MRARGRAFIASQAPEPTSVANFMQMLWDNDVPLAVMLCVSDVESSNECIPYWEKGYQESSSPHRIKCEHVDEPDDADVPEGVKKRILTISDGSTTKTVEHLQMLVWKDKKAPTPEVHTQLQFCIDRATEVRKNTGLQVVVHCSAGIGRTGTFIALVQMTELLKFQAE